MWVRALLTEEGVRHKQVCIRVDSEGQKNCLPPCLVRVFGFELRRSNLRAIDFQICISRLRGKGAECPPQKEDLSEIGFGRRNKFPRTFPTRIGISC